LGQEVTRLGANVCGLLPHVRSLAAHTFLNLGAEVCRQGLVEFDPIGTVQNLIVELLDGPLGGIHRLIKLPQHHPHQLGDQPDLGGDCRHPQVRLNQIITLQEPVFKGLADVGSVLL
jgi:hypothetical protein